MHRMAQLRKWFTQLKESERIIVLLLVSLILFFAWYLLIFSSLQAKDSDLLNQVQTKQQQISSAQKIIVMFKSQPLNRETTTSLQQKVLDLQQQIDTVTEKINAIGTTVQSVIKKLGEFADTQANLKIISLSSSNTVTDKKIDIKNLSTKMLTQNNIEIKLQGNYFATLNYLKLLETSGLNLFFQDFNYTVQTYPQAQATINLSVSS